MQAQGVDRWSPDDIVATPLDMYNTVVAAQWVDYNGHMTEAAYLTAAGWATDVLFHYVGVDDAYRAGGHSFYTVETHIHYLVEVARGEPLRITTQLLGLDAKRLHLHHEILHGGSSALLCTLEQMLVHVNMVAGRSAVILPGVFSALEAIAAAHEGLAIPSQVGSVMSISPSRRVSQPAD